MLHNSNARASEIHPNSVCLGKTASPKKPVTKKDLSSNPGSVIRGFESLENFEIYSFSFQMFMTLTLDIKCIA